MSLLLKMAMLLYTTSFPLRKYHIMLILNLKTLDVAGFLNIWCASMDFFKRITAMTRRCEITGKGPLVGNTVSHANNKTKRRFLPNLQEVSFFSAGLKRNVTVTSSTHGIRTVEHKGGIDSFLLGTAPTKLPAHLRKVRKQLVSKIGEKAPAPKAPRRAKVIKKPKSTKAA